MEGDEKPTVEAWQVEASKAPIEWTGDLNDDCTATWSGLMLRAEEMTRADWWWAVYDERTGAILGDSHAAGGVTSGRKARSAAEDVARKWLGGAVSTPMNGNVVG